jgi:hypothetical protein
LVEVGGAYCAAQYTHLRRSGFDLESDSLAIWIGDGEGALDELRERSLSGTSDIRHARRAANTNRGQEEEGKREEAGRTIEAQGATWSQRHRHSRGWRKRREMKSVGVRFRSELMSDTPHCSRAMFCAWPVHHHFYPLFYATGNAFHIIIVLHVSSSSHS